jgi:hypothetical protein
MKLSIRFTLFFLLMIGRIDAQSVYIDKAISASDHARKKPLMEAVDLGFNGISAEVELKKDGKLYCGSATLKERYLDPLRLRTNNGEAFVHPDHSNEFLLFLEVISDSSTTFEALKKELEAYHPMLTSYDGTRKIKKPIRVVIGGKVPHKVVYSENPRWIFAEENVTQLDFKHDIGYCTVASLKMKKLFDWKGEGYMPNMQYQSLGFYIKNGHKAGRWIRVYELPEVPNAFDLLLDAGADQLEIKDLKSFAEYWQKRKPY